MSGGSGDKTRALPQGLKTRNELKAQIQKHGSLAESEVLAHINKTAKPVWTHNDFVNFFQNSGQMVFRVRNNHLYLELSDQDSSEEEPRDIRSTLSVRSRSQNDPTVGTKNLPDDFNRGMAGLGSNGPSNALSGAPERRKDPRSAVRKASSSSSSDEDNTRGGGHRKPGSSGFTKPHTVSLSGPPPGFTRRKEYNAAPYGSDEEGGEAPRLENPEAVFNLVNANKRTYGRRLDVNKMVTMDPDPSNKIVPKINLGTKSDDDSSNDTDDENSDPGPSTQNARIRPPPVLQKPQASFQGGSRDHRIENGESSRAASSAVHRDLKELNFRDPDFWEKYFTAKENRDFMESRERNFEKILQDIMDNSDVSRADADLYSKYFVLLQSSSVECLSNGQLVAGILSLIEADPDQEMLRQIEESIEGRQDD